jgi:5-methyltetrahydrofolate--homocysteine methyltransferase
LEIGCRYYNGIPILNSVNGKSESLHNILPIAKKYGATIVALALDDQGIPETYQERIRIVEHILETGKQYGLEAHRFLFDPMVLPVSADIHNAKTTLDTLSNLPQGKYKTIMGVSNVSFGLPERKILNRSFLTLAMAKGVSSAILNPIDPEIMHVVQANRLLLSQSKTSDDYIAQVTGKEASILHADTLYEAILSGLKGNCDELTRTELKTRQPMQVVDEVIIKALATVGDQFNKGEVYLPRLMLSAEVAKQAFEVIRPLIAKSGKGKGKVILATVSGDIHDIGKNIVKVILESYGYDVVDLGKDVDKTIILDALRKHEVVAVGLSALMTTSVIAMQETIEYLRKELDVLPPIIVGGAVLTQKVAQKIHADHYCKEALEVIGVLEEYL